MLFEEARRLLEQALDGAYQQPGVEVLVAEFSGGGAWVYVDPETLVAEARIRRAGQEERNMPGRVISVLARELGPKQGPSLSL